MKRVYERLLIATDFSKRADPAQRMGIGLAQQLDAKATLFHALTSAPPLTLLGQPYAVWSDSTAEAQAVQQVRKSLEKIAVDMPESVMIDAVAGDNASRQICEYAGDQDIDLIVAGSHGRTGLHALLIGSVAERVVRHAPCDVLVARGDHTVPKRIIAATDMSTNADRGLDLAVELAQSCQAEVSALHVHVPKESREEEQVLREKLARMCAARALPVSGRLLVNDHPTDAICKHAEETAADLIVVSAHGMSALKRMLIGSVAERVVRHAPCSVLVVR